MPKLGAFAATACSVVWKRKRRISEIASLHHIDVLIVSDRQMAALHTKFCGIRGTTDVLTFQHGEIVISADRAAAQARNFRTSIMAEIQLYLLHGLLHLAGFDDATASKRKEMERTQRKLMKIILARTDDCE